MNCGSGSQVEQKPAQNKMAHSGQDTCGCDSRNAATPLTAAGGARQGVPRRAGHDLTFVSGVDAFLICRDLGLSRAELTDMSVRQLNVRMRMASLSNQQARAVKHLRRVLKNRGYAAICRNRRVVQQGHLEAEKRRLLADVEALEVEVGELKAELGRIDRDFTGLLNWCSEYRVLPAEQIQLFKDSP